MDVFLSFVSLVFLSAGLGIDNGLLIEFSLKSLNLERRQHLIWRSVALILAALLRILFLFSLSQLVFLQRPLPAYNWLPNRWFSKHPDELTWLSLDGTQRLCSGARSQFYGSAWDPATVFGPSRQPPKLPWPVSRFSGLRKNCPRTMASRR